MDMLERKFTSKEIGMLSFFGIVLLGALYFVLVDQPIRSGMKTARQEIESLHVERDAVEMKVAEIKEMEAELKRLEEGGAEVSLMPSYNAGSEELDFLHRVLGTASDYFIDFTDITREGDQIRRNFSLQFRTPNYGDAKEIIKNLENSEIRCLVGDLSVVPIDNERNILSGPVQVSAMATFYETMHGGKEDAELPEDSLAVEEEVEE